MDDDGGVKTSSSYEDQEEDRISSLTDDNIVQILSYLPTKEAVRTVLVPRFRHHWNHLPILTFHHHDWYFDDKHDAIPPDGPFYNEKFLNFVRHVLILHQRETIDKFRLELGLNFHFSKQMAAIPGYEDFSKKEKRMASEVVSWVYFAMRKKVKVLHLDFSVEKFYLEPDVCYLMPSVVFRGEYLAELKLVCCEIKPSGKIQLNCLKRLFLEEIVFNDEIFYQILGGCSVLEELSLIRCYGLFKLGFTNSGIKSLTLFHKRFHPFKKRRLELSCRDIESLDIAGRLDFVDLVDVSSLVVSSVCIGNLPFPSGIYETMKAYFENLGHCEAFRPSSSCILVFTAWQLSDEPGLLFGWKRVEFEVELTKWHVPGISCLLRSSPYLESLAMYISPECDTSELCKLHFHEGNELDGGNFWISQEGINFHCLNNHLKTIKVYGHITEPYVMESIEFLLMHAMVLEKLEISTRKTLKADGLHQKVKLTTEQRLEFSQMLLSLPRASSSVVVLFS